MKYICPILNRPTDVDEIGLYYLYNDYNAWSLEQCRETGFIFLANPPDYSQLETEFAWEETSRTERKRRILEEPILSRVSGFTIKARSIAFPRRNKIASLMMNLTRDMNRSEPLHLLDIGCGSGDLLVDICERFAKIEQTVIPHGIEVSKCLASISADRVDGFGGKVIFANAIDGSMELKFGSIHVVVMSSFLEHECRPLSLLQRLHPILTSDGAIILKVPNYASWNRIIRGRKWCGFRFPDHVNYFTPRTLRILAQEAGYIVSRQNFMDKIPTSDNMYAVLKKQL